MLLLTLAEKDSEAKEPTFDKTEIFIGRLASCDLPLSRGNISKGHAKLVEREGRVILVDLRSTNGTFVNGRRLSGPQIVKPDDEISIGDYILYAEVLEGEHKADVGIFREK
jgi:pilus assembly protein CpaF